MSRLLYVAPDFHPSRSGYGNACTGFVEALLRHTDVEVDVVTLVPLGSAPELQHGRLRVHRVSPRSALMRAAAFKDLGWALHTAIQRRARESPPDFILFETAEFPRTARRIVRTHGSRVAVRVHAAAETEWALYRDEPAYRQKRAATKRLFLEIPTILSTTPHYVDFVKERFLDRNEILIAGKNFAIVPNVLRERAAAAAPSPWLAQTLQEHVLLATLGRMDRQGELQKNFRRFLLALHLARDHPEFARVCVLIVGKGDRRPALEQLARDLGLDKTVHFHDSLSDADLHLLQSGAHGIFLGSTFEGLSMFALESLGAGGLLLFPREGGLAGMVHDGENGVTFDPLDPHDMAAAIRRHLTEVVPSAEHGRAFSRARFAARYGAREVARSFASSIPHWVALADTLK